MIPLAVTADIPRDFGFSFRQRLAHGFVHVHHPVFTRMVQIEHCVGAIVTGRTRGPSYGSRIPVIAGRIEENLIGTVSLCMNRGLDCGTTVPYGYSRAKANVWLSSLEPDLSQPEPQVLLVQDNWQNGGRTKNSETLPGRQRGNVELHQRQRFAVFRASPVLPVILHQ